MEYYSTITLYIALFTGLYFQIFFLLTVFDKSEEAKKNTATKSDGELPDVTIVIPCYNEAKTVAKTMWSLANLNYPRHLLDIMVIDDGSKDATYDAAERCRDEILANPMYKGLDIVVHRQVNGGKYTALNKGISLAKTELFGCLDADSTVESDALIKMVRYFSDDRTAVVTPAIRVHEPKTILQKMQKAEYNLGILAKWMFSKINAIHVTPGPFSIFRKSVFDQIGPFRHAHNTEDMEIAFRIQSHGLRIANCPTAYVYTITPPTLKKLYVQRTRWVSGFMKNTLDYKHIVFNPKFGHIGTFTMPFASASLLIAMALIVSGLYSFGTSVARAYERVQTVGIDWSWWTNPSFDIDMFFVTTEATMFLAFISLCLMVSIIFMSQKMVEGTYKPSSHIFWYLLLYGFICPLWIGKALYNTALAKRVPWR